MKQYGYIPPILPGDKCFADSAVALPDVHISLASLQSAILQLADTTQSKFDQLHVNDTLTQLQSKLQSTAATIQATASEQASQLSSRATASLAQVQDSLAATSAAVKQLAQSKLGQLDLERRVLQVAHALQLQEQQLVAVLPDQLQHLESGAVASLGLVEDSMMSYAAQLHVPELQAALAHAATAVRELLQAQVDELDLLLSQLRASCLDATAQLTHEAGTAGGEAARQLAQQLTSLTELVSATLSELKQQVWVGYQQLHLADSLSDLLNATRRSVKVFGDATANKVEALHLQQQLEQLQHSVDAAVAGLNATAVDQYNHLELQSHLDGLQQQVLTAVAAFQSGAVEQYHELLPQLQERLQQLKAGLQDTGKGGVNVPGSQTETPLLLDQLQRTIQSTANAVKRVAQSNVDHVDLTGTLAHLQSLGQPTWNTTVNAANNVLAQTVDMAKDATAKITEVTNMASNVYSVAAPGAVAPATAVPEVVTTVLQPVVPATVPAVSEAATAMWEAATATSAVPHVLDEMSGPGVPDQVREIWANRPL